MKFNNVLKNDKIYLRCIWEDDCKPYYVEWLNDELVNQYLETRHTEQNLNTIKDFVSMTLDDNSSYLFAIFETTTNKHIGNIKIGPINFIHNNAEISYFLGDKTSWGKGYATEAINLIIKFAFEELKLHRLQASLYSSNIGSSRCLEKSGFQLEGCLKDKGFYKNAYEDFLVFGLINGSD